MQVLSVVGNSFIGCAVWMRLSVLIVRGRSGVRRVALLRGVRLLGMESVMKLESELQKDLPQVDNIPAASTAVEAGSSPVRRTEGCSPHCAGSDKSPTC